MFKKLSKNIFQKRAQKYLKTSFRSAAFINYTQAKSILLIFESDYTEKCLEIKKSIENLNADGKQVTAIGYVNKKNNLSATYPEFKVMCNNDINLLGKPKQAILEHILHEEYDVLIDITTKSILPLEYIVLYTNAKCKTGMQKNNLKLYDFSIKMEDYLAANAIDLDDLKSSFLFNQILFYLKSIESKDF